MSFITSGSNTHVTNIRNMLTAVGIVQTLTTENERQILYSDDDGLHLFTLNTPLENVAGIWGFEDPYHDGTNYYNTASGSSFDSMYGKVYLISGSGLSVATPMLVDYAYRQGLTDENLNIIFDTNKIWLNAEFNANWTFAEDATEDVEQLAILTAYTYSVRDAIVQMNNSNAVQGGYSYQVGELSVQTKLWGEGMSMGELFRQYDNLCKRMRNTLTLVYDGAPIAIVNRSKYSLPYNERVFPAANDHIIDLGTAYLYQYGDRVVIVNNLR